MRVRARVLLVVGALLSLFIGTALPAQAATIVLSVGHVDGLYPLYQAGQLQDYVLDSTVTPSVTRNPADVLLEALPNSKATVPADPQYAFLGAPGSTVWILPQTQDPSLLWLGVANTEGIATGVFQGDQLVFRLLSVSGPGQFSAYDTGSFGAPTVVYNSSNAFPQDLPQPIPTHHHTNWAFGASGSYTVTFEVRGTLTNGTPVTTGPVAYHFQVDA